MYDFWDQDKGGKYLGSHVSIFPLGPLGSMSKGIKKSEMLDISRSRVSLLLKLL